MRMSNPEMSVTNFIRLSIQTLRNAKSELRALPGRFEHLLHDSDLDRLVGEYVRRKLVNRVVLRGAVSLEEIVHHIDRTLMVFDHPDEEQAVELRASGLVQ